MRIPTPARSRRQRGQSMVEFSLVAPIVFLLVFGLIDFGRFVYAYSAISNASREGARLLSLSPQATSDCLAMQRILAAGQGFTVQMDPRSVAGDIDPNNTSDPNYSSNGPSAITPPGTAYGYIFPAVAQGGSPLTQSPHCDKSGSLTTRPVGQNGSIRDVQVQIRLHFSPLTPLIGQIVGANGVVVTAISIVRTEY